MVLRSPRRDDPLVVALSALGGEVQQCPVQTIVPLGADAVGIRPQVERIRNYDKAIFVSRNATELVLCHLDQYDLSLAPQGQCFAVGPGSAALLEERGIKVVVPAEGWNSEALLALPALTKVAGQSIVVFRGEGGRAMLGDALIRRGANVEYCELYRREPDVRFREDIIRFIGDKRGVVLLAHSGEIIDALFELLGAQYREVIMKTPVLVPGERLCRYARALGFKHIITAASALPGEIESAMINWRA